MYFQKYLNYKNKYLSAAGKGSNFEAFSVDSDSDSDEVPRKGEALAAELIGMNKYPHAYKLFERGSEVSSWDNFFMILIVFYLNYHDEFLLPLADLILDPKITPQIKMETLCSSFLQKNFYIERLCLLYAMKQNDVHVLTRELNNNRKNIFQLDKETDALNRKFYIYAENLFEKYNSLNHPLATTLNSKNSIEEKMDIICQNKKNDYTVILCNWYQKYLFPTNRKNNSRVDRYILQLEKLSESDYNFGIRDPQVAEKKREKKREKKKLKKKTDKSYAMDLESSEVDPGEEGTIVLTKLRQNFNWPSFTFCDTRDLTHIITIDLPDKDNWGNWFKLFQKMNYEMQNETLTNLLEEACNPSTGDPLIKLLKYLRMDQEVVLKDIVKHLQIKNPTDLKRVNLEAYIQDFHGLDAAIAAYIALKNSQFLYEETRAQMLLLNNVEKDSPIYLKRITVSNSARSKKNSVNAEQNEQFLSVVQQNDKFILCIQKCFSQRSLVKLKPGATNYTCGRKLKPEIPVVQFLKDIQKPFKHPTDTYKKFKLPNLNNFLYNIDLRIQNKLKKMTTYGKDCPRANCTGVCEPLTPHFNSQFISENIWKEHYHYGSSYGMQALCKTCGAKICYYCGELWERLGISKEEPTISDVVTEKYNLLISKFSALKSEMLSDPIGKLLENKNVPQKKTLDTLQALIQKNLNESCLEIIEILKAYLNSTILHLDVSKQNINNLLDLSPPKIDEIIKHNSHIISYTVINTLSMVEHIINNFSVEFITNDDLDGLILKECNEMLTAQIQSLKRGMLKRVQKYKKVIMNRIKKNTELLIKITPNRKKIYHKEDLDCDQYAVRKKANESGANVDDELTEIWKKKNSMACPFCKAIVSRSAGCNFMTHDCTDGIRRSFCYCCGIGFDKVLEDDNAAHYPNGYFQPCKNRPCKIKT